MEDSDGGKKNKLTHQILVMLPLNKNRVYRFY